MPLCIPHQIIDAFHESEDDEHTLFHVPQHRANDHSCVVEDSRAAVQHYLSLCTHQDCCCTSAWIVGHCMERFNFL